MNDRSSTVDQVSESVWKRKQRYQEHVNLVARVPMQTHYRSINKIHSPYCVIHLTVFTPEVKNSAEHLNNYHRRSQGEKQTH